MRRSSLLPHGTLIDPNQSLKVASDSVFACCIEPPLEVAASLCYYGNTRLQVHKTQALSIKHLVLGCLEGVFALGQVYVLVSRVTDPKNFSLVGIPPRDLVEDLAQALLRAGIDVDSFFEKACQVSGEWKYDRSRARVLDRIQQKFSNKRTVPLRFRTLGICFL